MVYLFTFHAYGSWMPDRPQGYVERGKGIQPTNREKADAYRARMKQPAVVFTPELQETMLKALRDSQTLQDFRLHAISIDTTHVHLLVSWTDGRPLAKLKAGLRQSLSRAVHVKPAFGRGGSQKRVEDRSHLDHLVKRYLPRHRGLFWRDDRS